MNSQKGFVIPIIIAIFAVLTIGVGYLWYSYDDWKIICFGCDNQINKSTTTTPIVGGDRDVHGCIGSAGYSWCEVKNKCLRVWEEKCEATTTSQFRCKNDNDCKEISCVGGGFAHELCTEGKCIMSDEVKNKCSAQIK